MKHKTHLGLAMTSGLLFQITNVQAELIHSDLTDQVNLSSKTVNEAISSAAFNHSFPLRRHNSQHSLLLKQQIETNLEGFIADQQATMLDGYDDPDHYVYQLLSKQKINTPFFLSPIKSELFY